MVFLVVGGYLSAKLVTRFGAKPVLVVGMAVQVAGFLLLAQLSVGTSYFLGLMPAMLVVSLGAAASFTAFNIAALTGAREGEEGLASGLINTSTQMGGPVGLAIAVTIVGVVTASVGASLGASSALVEGFRYAFLGGAVLTGIGVVVAGLLKRPSMIVTQTEPAVAPLVKVSEPEIISGVTHAPAADTQVEPDIPLELKRIVVAVDGSAYGNRAASTAIKFGKDYRAELVVVRVVQTPTALTPSSPRAGGAGSAILKEYYDSGEKDAEAYVNSVVARAKLAGLTNARGEVLRTAGSPSEAITSMAKTEGADLIVIGTRGLGRPGRFFLGSVSSGVVAKAEMTVLVVK
jgi:nucleotide-binding universal stress UspA family protein